MNEVQIRKPPPPPTGRRTSREDTAHVRRVTYNLVRLSAACPASLRTVLDRLADEAAWDLDGLTAREVEAIYAGVDGPLADRAVAEFVADTTTVIDHARLNRTVWASGELETSCKLCGHQHIRFEFLLRNTAGGRDVWTGSDCIIQYGLAVDGEVSAEEALKKLSAALNRAVRDAERDWWQADHPTHAEDMAVLVRLGKLWGTYRSWLVPHRMTTGWEYRLREDAKRARPIVKYYGRERFLTELRTQQVYAATGLLARATATLDEFEALNPSFRNHRS